MRRSQEAVIAQLRVAGYWSPVIDQTLIADGSGVRFLASPALREVLMTDPRFLSGVGHGLHRDIGADRVDYRSVTGAFGRGSLQIVISQETWCGYADIDRHNPYQDVVRFIGHTVGEVLWPRLRRLWRA